MEFECLKFKNPSKEHNVLYTWVWNSPVTKEKIDKRLLEYKKAGITGLYILPLPRNFRAGYMDTYLEPEYLSGEFFDLVEYAFEKALSLGMEIWIYDEGGWPSGGACGLTGKQNPEAYETRLLKRDVVLKRGEKYSKPNDVLAVFDGVLRLEDNFTAQKDMVVCEYFAWKCDENHPSRIDGTNKSAVDTFLNNTYQKYYERFGKMFGTDIKVIFTDEPSNLKNTVSKNMFGIFKSKYGYDLTDYLPFLLDGDLPKTKEQQQARIDYARLLGELFCENYCKNISSWCKEHNIKLAGHLDIDHTAHSTDNHAYFSHLNCLTQFGIPGVDVIWEQISYPYNNQKPVKEGYAFFPKIASSAAHQNGGNLALSETFAVYGDGITPDEMRYILNYQAVRGINVFNFMLTTLDSENHNALVERPVFSPEKPGFYNLEHINTYYKRLSYLLKLGKPVCDTALYNPCADFWADNTHRDKIAEIYNETGEMLEKYQISFDIIDDYAIRNAKVTEQGLMVGDMLYSSVVVPECQFMPSDIKEKITPFVKVDLNTPLIKGLNENLRVKARKLQNGRLYFIFNQGYDTVSQKIDLPTENLYQLDLVTGECYKLSNTDITLVCGDMAVLFVANEKIPAKNQKVENRLVLDDIKPKSAKRFVLSEKGLVCREAKLCEIDCDFSGEITYTAHLSFDEKPSDTDRYRIKLNDTKVSARLLVNGKQVATFGMTPMYAVVSGNMFERENEIEIIVSNTASNEIIANHKIIENFPKRCMGSYDEKSVKFEARRYEIKLGKVVIEKLVFDN